jgi:hypothetical protein
MSVSPPTDHVLKVADLNERRPTLFEIQPDVAQLRQIADDLSLISLKKLRFKGTLVAHGKREWLLTATLGATVQQSCVITLNLSPRALIRRSPAALSPKHRFARPKRTKPRSRWKATRHWNRWAIISICGQS